MGPSTKSEPYYEVASEGEVLIVTRTARRYTDVNDIEPSFDALHAAIDRVADACKSLVVDLRQAVGRNDPSFEERLAPARRRLLRRFPHVVVLVRSQAGRMQLARYLSADGIDIPVFMSKTHAMAEARRLSADD